jgi:hypothetical protein
MNNMIRNVLGFTVIGGFDFDETAGGSGTGGGMSISTSGTGGGMSISTSGTGGGTSTSTGGIMDPCSPGGSCPGVKSECLALTDYTDKTQFTLRMADLTLTAPPALSAGTVAGIFKSGITINLKECNLDGGGTFSWLLQFDTALGVLKAGGAKPTLTPTAGYSFVNEMIGGFAIAPLVTYAPIKDGKFTMAMGADLTIPIYLDAKATSVILLPLHAAKLSGTLSADNNCIGKYNSKGLLPADNCIGPKEIPAFIGADGKANSDGTLDGFITLEDADKVMVDLLKQSLCVILSGDSAQFGDGGTPLRCKRDAGGKIVFQGDWCTATNDAACKDAVHLVAGFSASGVKVN